MTTLRPAKFVVTDICFEGAESPVFEGLASDVVHGWPLFTKEEAEKFVLFVNPLCRRSTADADFFIWDGENLVCPGYGDGPDVTYPIVDGLYNVGYDFCFWKEV